MKSHSLLPEQFLRSLGISEWGYTEEPIPNSFARYEAWVAEGNSKPLGYLADERKDLRKDIRLIFPEFQSALVFLFPYTPTKKWMLENQRFEIAGYALGFEGEDYHFTLKRKLTEITRHLEENIPTLKTFTALDAQPVLERDLAFRAGLGWFGKNSMLINQKEGSYFIIGSLLLNQKLAIESQTSDVDHCGQCLACVEACPTNAIDPVTRTLRASDCISTFTIEVFKDQEPPNGFENSRGEIFGCDICQDVCPWNRKPLMKSLSSLALNPKFLFLKELFYGPKDVLSLLISKESNRGWRKKLQGSALDRPGKEGWLKNLKRYFQPK